jgi:hypothetical protein
MPSPPRVDLFARAAVAGDHTRQRAVEARLRRLADRGAVAAVRTHHWPGRVHTPVDDDAAAAVDWFERVRSWAADRGGTVEPFFGHHARESAFTGTRHEEYVFPVLAVTVRRDDTLVAAAPHTAAAGETVDVEAVVDALADGETPPEGTAEATG